MSTKKGSLYAFIYLFLILPFGMVSGYIGITLAYQLTHAGVSTLLVAGFIAIYFIPQTWKFLWAPFIDTLLTHTTWYYIGSGLMSIGFLACGVISSTILDIKILSCAVFSMSIASTIVGMSVEALMANNTPEEYQGRVGGWFQVGNLGGSGIGGGMGLWLVQHTAISWIAGVALAVVTLLCALPLLLLTKHQCIKPTEVSAHSSSNLWSNFKCVMFDLSRLIKTQQGSWVFLLSFLPIGCGASMNLWASVAGAWNVSADTVALINGTMGGLISVPGCLLGGYLCDRFDRKTSYLVFGLIQASCLVLMAFVTHNESMFIFFTLAYAFVNGLIYAGYTVLLLEVISSNSAATQYNVFASLSNIPIMYMTLINGSVFEQYGGSSMLCTEALLAVMAVVVIASSTHLIKRARSDSFFAKRSFLN